MLRPILTLAMLAPFWVSKPPAQWTDEELQQIFTDSPWAQAAVDAGESASTAVYLATAPVMQQAEAERERRGVKAPARDDEDESDNQEYKDFLRDNRGKVIVLAVEMAPTKALDDAGETKRLQNECRLRLGRKKYQITGFFPPSASDPYLRLVFPRAVMAADKKLIFELYLPGEEHPYRLAEFPASAGF